MSNRKNMNPQTETKKQGKNKPITINGKFKTANLFNDTIHIILYPNDALRTAVSLQEIDEYTDITLDLKKNS